MRILLLTWIVGAILHSANFASAATVTFGTPSNASNYVSDAASTPIIYGAIAGVQTDCNTTASNSFCNNCLGPDACSERRVHENLILRIPFTVTAETANFIYFGIVDGGSFTELTGLYTKSDTGKVAKDTSQYIEIPWGSVMDAMGAGSTGVTPEDSNFFVAIAPDNSITTEEASQISIKAFAPGGNVANDIRDILCTDGKDGVCSFVAGPGDEKVYIDPIEPSGSYPTVDNVPVKFLRVYYSNNPGADVRTDVTYASNYVDLDIDSGGAPDPNKVEGLVNGDYYGFKVAIVDEAYNVSLLTSAAQILLECPGGSTIDLAGDGTCVYVTKPSNVVGLLPEDINCFISTAAFGSSMASKVQDFRRFRNRVLLQNDAGAELVNMYYSFGPRAAKFIHDYPALKPFARAMLWPIWAYSMASLKFGFGTTLISFFILSFSIAGIIIWGIIKCAPIQRRA
jgi:hypothetical protein